MKRKKKGRRIYTYRARNRRMFSPYHRFRSLAGTIVMLVLIAAFGFVGYNIVGPLVTRIRAEADSPTTTPEPFFEEADAGTIPSETTAATTETVLTETELTTTTVTTVTTTVTELTETTTETTAGMTVAYLADAAALSDLDSLDAAAAAAAEKGCQALLLPMKQTGGMLSYASEIDTALGCGASNKDMLTLREIRNAAKRYQLGCIAMMSTLEDQMYPSVYNDGSYTFNDGTVRWLDNKVESGGKPWLNPFTDAAGNYLADVAKELSDGGMNPVICTDIRFPDFFKSDAELLGDRIFDPAQRRKALVNLLNKIAAAEPQASFTVDLHTAVTEGVEYFVPEELTMQSVCMVIDPDAFTEAFSIGDERYDPSSLSFADKATLLLNAAEKAADGRTMIPCLSAGSLNERDIAAFLDCCEKAEVALVLVQD